VHPQFGLLTGVLREVKSLPAVTDPVRSLTPGSTPLSITATVTLAP